MPLSKGKSKAAFQHNVREMVKAGHPVKQALAAAYSVQRKSHDKAKHHAKHSKMHKAPKGGRR